MKKTYEDKDRRLARRTNTLANLALMFSVVSLLLKIWMLFI